MEIKADLHIHSTFSDGALSPTEIVRRAKEAGLSIISITDHDSVSGIEEAAAEGKKCGIEVVEGHSDIALALVGSIIYRHEQPRSFGAFAWDATAKAVAFPFCGLPGTHGCRPGRARTEQRA